MKDTVRIHIDALRLLLEDWIGLKHIDLWKIFRCL